MHFRHALTLMSANFPLSAVFYNFHVPKPHVAYALGGYQESY